MVRTPTFDKNGIKKGAWSLEEDQLLRDYITRYGHWNWRELPKFAGLKRCGKSCRLRWMNYLRPNLKHGNYTKEEENLIIEMHLKHGNKWAILASKLPGRTDNEIKNYWHTHLKKRVKPETSTYKTQPEPRHTNKSMNNQLKDSISDHDIQILESCPILSPEMASSSTSTLSSYEISTTAFDDDGGLEEIINSTELFSELSTSLSPLGNEFMNDDELQDDDFWRNIFVNNSEEAVLSPYVNYDDDLLDLLNMEEFLEG